MTKSISNGFQILVFFTILYPKYKMKKIGMLTSGRFGMSMLRTQRIVSAGLTSNEEPANIKFAKENSKAVNQDEEHRPSTTPVCNVRLPSVVIGVFREIKSLGFHASI